MRPYLLACVSIVLAMGIVGTMLSLLALRPDRDGPIPTATLIAWRRRDARHDRSRFAAVIGSTMVAMLVALVVAIY